MSVARGKVSWCGALLLLEASGQETVLASVASGKVGLSGALLVFKASGRGALFMPVPRDRMQLC
eukprot:1157930-Pelagomonas_calceolata.AAC.7